MSRDNKSGSEDATRAAGEASSGKRSAGHRGCCFQPVSFIFEPIKNQPGDATIKHLTNTTLLPLLLQRHKMTQICRRIIYIISDPEVRGHADAAGQVRENSR